MKKTSRFKCLFVSVLVLLITLTLKSCTPQKRYWVEKYSAIGYLSPKTANINYIPISDNDLLKSPFLDSAFYLIRAKKYQAVYRQLDKKFEKGNRKPDAYLVKTLLLISQRDYRNAVRFLPMAKDDYPKLTELLSIDLAVEIQRIDHPNGPVSKFFSDYQSLADKYPDDPTLKSIIAIRIRFLQYSI